MAAFKFPPGTRLSLEEREDFSVILTLHLPNRRTSSACYEAIGEALERGECRLDFTDTKKAPKSS